MGPSALSIQRRLVLALSLLVTVVIIGTAGYRIIVGGSILDCLYMTVITIPGVGYGEVLPGLTESPGGRVFTMGLIACGLGLSAYLVSTLTALVVEGELTNLLRRRKMDKRISLMKDHVVVCGAGTTGMHVVAELLAIREPFVVVEQDKAHLERALAGHDVPHVIGDATTDDALERAGVGRARAVVTVLGSDKDNLFVTISVRQINDHARIVARGIDLALRERLVRAGANAVVFPNQIGGLRLVSELIRPHVVGFLDRMLRAGTGEQAWRFEEIEVGTPAEGRTLGSLQIDRVVGVPVLAMTTGEGRQVSYYPPDDTVLLAGTRLVVLAERAQVEKLRTLVAGS